MSAKVHYGAPGSFKTSGAIFDDLVPALRVGRKIVTNINGFGTTVSVDEIYNVLSSNKISFEARSEIINLSLNSVSDMEKMRTWWHWIDDGVLLFFDEIQVIYPKTWREDREFKKLSIPEVEAERTGRFPALGQALQQHRHKNWDIIFTTPDISLLNKYLKSVTEISVRHVNLGIFGRVSAGAYKEVIHLADQTFKTPLNSTRKKVPTWVFSIYSSTQTGQFSDTKAGFSIFSNPRIIIVGIVLFAALIFIAYSEFSKGVVQVDDSKHVSVVPQKNDVSSQKNDGSSVGGAGAVGAVPTVKLGRGANRQTIDYVGIFKDSEIYVDSYGEVFGQQLLTVSVFRSSKKKPLVLNEIALRRMGYQIIAYSPCYIVLHSVDADFFATCAKDSSQPPSALPALPALPVDL